MSITQAPPRFLAGQETAVVNRLGGGPALPTFQPPRVSERGLGGAPTLVQNVETLAHLALIARYGPRWFRAVGTAAEPGSMLTTIYRPDGKAHVREAAIGTPLRTLLGDGAEVSRAQAWLVGGYHGTWLPMPDAAGITLDNASLRQFGAAAGAGVLAALPSGRCGLTEAARVTRYLAAESAGQCGPCLNGLPRIAAALAELAGPGHRRQTLADLKRWSGNLVEGRGACNHPDGTVRFVRSALVVFEPEIQRHARGQCSATDRKPFLPLPAGHADQRRRLELTMAESLRVNPIQCTGHGVCAELLPELVTLDEWGYPMIDPGPVPPALDRDARRAVGRLPRPRAEADQERNARPFGLKDVVTGGCGVAGIEPSRPAWKSSNAWASSARVFMTNGPYAATGSRIGSPPSSRTSMSPVGPGRERDRVPGPEHGQLPHPDRAFSGAHGARPR